MITSIVLSAFSMTILSVLLCQKVFIKNNLFDKINLRSSHKSIATRSGGLSLFCVLIIVSIFFYLNGTLLYDYSILVPLSILFCVGLYDDAYDVDFKLKFIFQIIVAKIIIDSGLVIDNLHGVFSIFEINRIAAQILTIFIIISIINAINFIDGIDGLAISISLLFIFLFEFFSISKTDFYNLSLIISVSILPLYYFNFRKKNKVFLGDSGSYLLGGIISIYVLYILSQDYIIKPEYDIHKILFVISILLYPIIDIIRIFIKRVYLGKSPFIADKNHIHHLILDKVKSHFNVVTILLIISILIMILFQFLF